MSQWNTLSVPLENGWQCTLVLASEYCSASGKSLAFTRSAERKQHEQDRKDFDRHFRPRYDLRTVTGNAKLDTILSFLSDILKVVHWELPTDNAGIKHMLRKAVSDGRLLPVVNREWRSLPRVTRATPAPERWPSGEGGFGGRSQKWAAFACADSGRPISFNGEPVLSGSYDPAMQEARLIAARGATAASGGGGDLLGVVATIAGLALGIDSGAAAEDSGDTSTLLADAQPFEYTTNLVEGDADQIAGMPFHGAPGSWASSMPGTMPQLRQYGASGTPMTDIDFEAHHGNANPHAHNWDGTNRDQGWPVSILP